MDYEKQNVQLGGLIETLSESSSSTTQINGEQERDLEVQKSLRNKFDRRVLPCGVLIYLMAFIDRSNMGNARLLGMEKDLLLTGNRFNISLTAFFCTYIIFEVPANMMCKRVGSRWWLGTLTTGFGLITMCIAFVESFETLVVTRVLLGVFEAGILPGIVFTFSQYYKRHEIATRLGIQSSTASVAGSFGGLLAIGLSSIPPCGILHEWRYIFLIEGVLTMLVGIFVFCVLPTDLASASFLTSEEKKVALERIRAEHLVKGADRFDWKAFKHAMFHVPTQLIGLGLICSLLCMTSVALFMPTLLKSMGFDHLESQFLTVPPYAVSAMVCIGTAILSDRIKRRGILLCVLSPCIVIGFAILATVDSKGAKYFAIFLATAGGFSASPLLLTWSVDNAAGPTARAIVSAYAVGLGNFGSLIGTWTYLPQDAPKYLKGSYLNMSFGSLLFVIVLSLMAYLAWENKQRQSGKRDGVFEDLTASQVDRLGHNHPQFVFTV